MIKKLNKRNVPLEIISLITSLFAGCTTRVLVNQIFTNKIDIKRGLFQGSILSPILFNIFINDLATEITEKFPNDPLSHCLFYAEYMKLVIFKMYIRPIMEHGACLAFYWMKETFTKKLKN